MTVESSASQAISLVEIEIDEEGIQAAVDILRSGNLRQGPVCAEFERRFAELVGAEEAVVVNSGTAALHLAWMALLKPGDEVLVPAFTFIATASAVVLAGGVPVFCDVDPETWTLDVEDARRRLTRRTRGIGPVHLYGQVSDVAGIMDLAQKGNLEVVWDAAQAHRSLVGAQDVGSLPGMSCYSFYPSKAMTTGEGGMIVLHDHELAERLRLLRSHGQARKYFHIAIGLNYRMTDFQAAIGLSQVGQLPGWIERRRTNASRLTEALSGIEGLVLPAERPGTSHSYHQYTVRITPEAAATRDEVAARLRELGVESAVHYPRPLHQQPVFETEGALRLPVSERLSNEVLSIPVHQGLTDEELDRVAAAMHDALAR